MKNNFPYFLICVSAILFICAGAYAERTTGTVRQEGIKEANSHYAAGKEFMDKENYAAADEEFKKAQEILNSLSPSAAVEPSGLTTGPEGKKTDPNIYYNLGIDYIKSGEFRKATKALRKAIQLNPKDADACYNLGVLYDVYLGDKKQAADYYGRYIMLAPESKDAEQVKLWIESSRKEIPGGR